MTNLFYNFYMDKDEDRNEELVYSLYKNKMNKHIDNIFIIGDTNEISVIGDVLIHHDTIPTFEYIFNLIKSNSSEDDINIIINSDCFIEEEDMHMLGKLGKSDAWCLTRHDITSIEPFEYVRKVSDCSQDCWVFYGHPNISNINFEFGRAGCDNRLSYELSACGLNVTNPSLSFRVYHNHKSDVRTTFGSNSSREVNRVHGNYKMLDQTKI